MPRFHFNIYDGVSLPDPHGTELPDWHSARIEAIRLSGEIVREDAKRLALGQDWHMEVTDNAGLVLFRLDFSIMEAPATQSLVR